MTYFCINFCNYSDCTVLFSCRSNGLLWSVFSNENSPTKATFGVTVSLSLIASTCISNLCLAFRLQTKHYRINCFTCVGLLCNV